MKWVERAIWSLFWIAVVLFVAMTLGYIDGDTVIWPGLIHYWSN